MCQKINKQNDITETGMGDKSWQHFNKNIQGITHTKSLGKNFPGVEIVDRKDIGLFRKQRIPLESYHIDLKLFQRANEIY